MGAGMRMQRMLSVGTLRFNKTGAQIKESVTVLIKEYDQVIDAAKTEIAAICEKRQIDAKDILQAKDEESFVNSANSYSTSMGGAMENVGAKGPMQALQADIDKVEALTKQVTNYFNFKKNYEAILHNLDDGQKFEIPFSELHELGFR